MGGTGEGTAEPPPAAWLVAAPWGSNGDVRRSSRPLRWGVSVVGEASFSDTCCPVYNSEVYCECVNERSSNNPCSITTGGISTCASSPTTVSTLIPTAPNVSSFRPSFSPSFSSFAPSSDDPQNDGCIARQDFSDVPAAPPPVINTPGEGAVTAREKVDRKFGDPVSTGSRPTKLAAVACGMHNESSAYSGSVEPRREGYSPIDPVGPDYV